jgi:ribose transport system permease protein
MASGRVDQRPAQALRPAEVFGRLRESQAWVLVLLLVLGTLLISPGVVTGANGQDLLRQCAILGLLAVGESVVIFGGGIDLSVAANVRVAGVIGASYFGGTAPSFTIGVIITMAVAVGVGALNGLLIGFLRMPSFITTLAVMLTLDGVTLMLADSAVGAAPDSLILFYTQKLWFVPMPTVLLVVVAGLVAFCLRSTVWGKSVYAVGGSPILAGHAGVRVRWTMFTLYVVSGALAGVAALALLSRSGVGDPIALQGAELQAITAAVIGGVSLAGGRGSVAGALGGVAFLTLVSVLLSQAGVPDRFQVLAQGVLILAALATYRARRPARR